MTGISLRTDHRGRGERPEKSQGGKVEVSWEASQVVQVGGEVPQTRVSTAETGRGGQGIKVSD